MKIIDAKVYILSTVLEKPFYFSQGWVRQRNAVLLEVITNEGVVGWGEALCHGLQPPEIAASILNDCYIPMILGRSPLETNVLWEEMYNRTRPFGQGGAAVNALSAVDIALWDIIGKLTQKPIHQLLGGAFRNEVTPYATGFYRQEGRVYPDAGVEEALQHCAKGFTAMKLKTGFGVKEDIQYIHKIREAVGFDIRLMADANCAYHAGAARRIMLECESAKLYFWEELLAPEDREGYRMLRSLTSSYMAAGENILTKYEYRHWISQGALDIIQPDLCSSGGFTECRKISHLAQAWNLMLIPHVWGSGIGLAASLQFLATIPPTPLSLNPEEPMLEYDQSDHPFRNDLIFGAISMGSNGKIGIPNAPGIGVEVNRDCIQRYKKN